MKKAVKIPLIVLGSIIGLLLVVLLLLSPIAKNYVEKHDQELMGRELSMGKLWVNPFSGTVKIKDLTLYEEDGTTPFVHFDRFTTTIKLRELLNHRLWVKRATLSGLNVNVEQDRDWFNFTSLLERFSSNTDPTESSRLGLVFNEVNIENGAIRYADLARGSELMLRDIALFVPALDLADMKTDVGLDLALSDEALLHTDIRLSDNGKKFFINLKINKLSLDVIEPYLQQNYPVNLLTGWADLDLEAEGPTDHIMDLVLKGNLTLNEVELQDMEEHPLGVIDSVFAEIKRLRLNDKEADLGKLHLSALKAKYIVEADSTTNFDFLLSRDTTEVASEWDTITIPVEEPKSWKVSIDDLVLDQAEVLYEDHTLPEVFHYEISDINLTSRRFTLDGDNSIHLEAMLNHVGKLFVNWRGSLHGLDKHDLTLMLNNVQVADFSPYTMQLFGVPVTAGTLSFRSQNVINDGNINGVNKLQTASLKLGDKNKKIHPKYPKVPLKLGVYLLADRNNNISVDLPVSGNLNDPQFSYRKTLRKVFFNVLAKVAASPFRLMTDEDNNLKYIPFDPLQFDFSPEQYVMIDNVVVTLQSRSDLAIMLEEQVQYDEVVKELCIIQLKRDYYLSTHPGTKFSDLDFLSSEAIRSIKLNDKGLCDYATQYSKKKRLRSAKDVTSVACEVYRDKSEKMLPGLMARRNELLSDYLWKVKGLTPEQISVTTIDASLMKSFVKPSRYEMHVFRYEDMEDAY
jgi:hypothetical protein